MANVEKRDELKGKLGVFWHTQGSGKSYSMVMFVRKVRRKVNGNFTFLIITDRDDLDTQIHKTFVRTEVIGEKEECQPKDSAQLREFLSGNKPILFTLIHKFGYDKTKKYPLLSERDDIFVLVDEAHRTQYKQLAENMHTGIPNANYIAFTGTPLLGSKRLTNQWFGDYVSEYNFGQAVEDGSTVPLFYSRRVPEVGLDNDWLDTDEVQKFKAQGLDIESHRKKMNEITPEGKDIEDRFKDKDDKLQLVFVCAMWLTGFDVPSLSTLYLDKPMKNHTLMQAIARANRVFPGKPCGIIVDYVNVFKYMQQALSEYATGDDGSEFPAKDIDQLIANIDQCIVETDQFLLSLDISLDMILEEADTLNQIEMYRKDYNRILEKDEWKDRFKVLANLLGNLYEASKPEIFERSWSNEKFSPIMYLIGLFYNQIDDEKLARAKAKMAEVLDRSVASAEAEDKSKYIIHEGKVIDLSKLDVEGIRKAINETPYKALEVDDLSDYIEKVLEQMINKNCTRIKFSERYKSIINRYNAGGSENEDYYEKLLELIEELKKEQRRATEMDLEEEELEIFDLLIKDRKLTKAEEQKVKLAAKNLYKKLLEEKNNVMVVDWYKDEQPRQRVLGLIQVSLNNDLPESYDREVFSTKTNLLMNHFIDMAVQGYGWVA